MKNKILFFLFLITMVNVSGQAISKGLYMRQYPTTILDTFRIRQIQLLDDKSHYSCSLFPDHYNDDWRDAFLLHVENENGILVVLSPVLSECGINQNTLKVSDSCILELMPHDTISDTMPHWAFCYEVKGFCYYLNSVELWFQNIYSTDNLDGLNIIQDTTDALNTGRIIYSGGIENEHGYNQCDEATIVSRKDKKMVIFSEFCPDNCYWDDITKRWNPTIYDVSIAEEMIKKHLIKLEEKRKKQLRKKSPKKIETYDTMQLSYVLENLNNYIGQYRGFINEKGEKILFANYFNKDKEWDYPYWKKYWVVANGKKGDFWQIKVNSKKKKCFDYRIRSVKE